MGLFDKLKAGLKKTSNAIAEQVNSVFSVFVKVDEELFENLEEALSQPHSPRKAEGLEK